VRSHHSEIHRGDSHLVHVSTSLQYKSQELSSLRRFLLLLLLFVADSTFVNAA